MSPRGRPKGSRNKPKPTLDELGKKDTRLVLNAAVEEAELADDAKDEVDVSRVSSATVINKDWRIASTSMNVILFHRKSTTHVRSKPDGDVGWNQFYYATPAGALHALVIKEVLGTGMKDLKAVVDKIDQLSQDIKTALPKLSTVP